jgi:uncharacterized iron-regulated protein
VFEKIPARGMASIAILLIYFNSAWADESATARIWQSALEPGVEAAARELAGISPPAAVFVGEVHDRLSYHVNQLAAIIALREKGERVAVGLEMIQTPFQSVLDEYVSGDIGFEEMLLRTEYFTRWGYDARLYQPIFDYARLHGLPLLALNASAELTARVREVGIEGLDADERAVLPDTITPPAPSYRVILEEVYSEHTELTDSAFERFVELQLTWDETMALAGARFLRDNPDHVLVVLAGIQHVAMGHGVPSRMGKHVEAPGTVVLSDVERDGMPGSADVYLDLPDVVLPDSGRMGVLIRPVPDAVIVDGFAEGSPAEQAGIQADDVLVDIDGRAIERFQDVRIALWNKAVGDEIRVTVRRDTGTRLETNFKLF